MGLPPLATAVAPVDLSSAVACISDWRFVLAILSQLALICRAYWSKLLFRVANAGVILEPQAVFTAMQQLQ